MVHSHKKKICNIFQNSLTTSYKNHYLATSYNYRCGSMLGMFSGIPYLFPLLNYFLFYYDIVQMSLKAQLSGFQNHLICKDF